MIYSYPGSGYVAGLTIQCFAAEIAQIIKVRIV